MLEMFRRDLEAVQAEGHIRQMAVGDRWMGILLGGKPPLGFDAAEKKMDHIMSQRRVRNIMIGFTRDETYRDNDFVEILDMKCYEAEREFLMAMPMQDDDFICASTPFFTYAVVRGTKDGTAHYGLAVFYNSNDANGNLVDAIDALGWRILKICPCDSLCF